MAFEPPEGFRDFAFWPVGLDRRYKWPFPEKDRPFLVMSPFLGDWFLKEIKQQGRLRFVISRPESLAAVSEESLEKVEECLVMEEGSALDVNDGDAEAALLHALGDHVGAHVVVPAHLQREASCQSADPRGLGRPQRTGAWIRRLRV